MNFSKTFTLLFLCVFALAVQAIDKTYAVAFCISDWPGGELCGVTATIGAPPSVNYNTSASVQFTPGGIFETYNSRTACAGIYGGCGIYFDSGYSRQTVTYNVGPITSGITVTYEVHDVQGSSAYDSAIIGVNAAPPSATIQFQ